MAKKLIIVESPAKAKTISRYLGRDYVVESSIGHIRDLPKNASEIPDRYRNERWARLGLDLERDFQPLYIVSPEKRSQVAKLKSLAKDADEIVLATDDDREGESIAWHLREELKPRVPVKRMVFHEITREAIENALDHPRDIDENLVQAQETRRALDRLYGFEVSPVLWKKVQPKLSAGRVQSVATRMLVERERERMRFTSANYFDLEAQLETARQERFSGTLVELGGTRLASGRDFDPVTGQLKPEARVVRLDREQAEALAAGLQGRKLQVLSTEEKPFAQRPYAPFITSTLQQEGSRKLGWSAQRTMRTAQRLYEGGYITYMRTDSTNLSREATEAARKQVRDLYGQEYLHPTVRSYEKKVKNAQEAHEAIRPSGASFRRPESLRGELDDDGYRLYDLVWKRTVASQMADARGRRLAVRSGGKAADGRDVVFASSGKTIDFPGFLRAYVEGSDDPDAALEDREIILPALAKGDHVDARKVDARGHDTQPPARYTEASLVQALEAAGIGRPSTYAAILSTIQERGYVRKRGSALVPTLTAFAAVGLLEQHFPRLVDYGFTARMEEDLDDIAAGEQRRAPYLRAFYFGQGSDQPGLRDLIESRLETIDPRQVATIDVPRLEGSGIEVRVGRYGPFLKKGQATAPIPEDLAPDELTPEGVEALLDRGGGDRTLGTDPQTGLPVIARSGRFGPYVQLGEGTPPVKSASLLASDKLENLTLERALQLLSLPRLVGTIDGEEVWAQNGRFGPYIKKGNESRSLADPESLFSLTLDEARALLSQPKTRGRAASGPARTFPLANGKTIELRNGRFGPYLSDGENLASLRRGEDPDELTAEDAAAILAERGKPPKKAARKSGGARGASTRTPAAKPARPAARAGTRATTTKKATATRKAPAKAKAAPKGKAPASEKPSWNELAPHARQFDPQTAELLRLVIGEGNKIADAATRLGLSPDDALSRWRSSNFKLYSLYRQAKQAG